MGPKVCPTVRFAWYVLQTNLGNGVLSRVKQDSLLHSCLYKYVHLNHQGIYGVFPKLL